MEQIAVLIPCYNEEKTIGKVVDECKHFLPQATVYVYNNNSTDNTAAIAAAHGAIVRREPKQGKGNVVRSMFRDIDAQCYFMIDGDDTYSLENAPQMCRLVLEQQADMVVGDRLSSTYFTENKRRFHNMGNRLVRNLINWMFQSKIRDIMTGCRAFSYRFVKTFPVLSKGFEIETEMTIHAVDKNLYVENVIVDYRDRPSGSISKLNTINDGTRVIKTVVKLYKNYKPFRFFGAVSAILFISAVLLFLPVLIDYLHTGLVARFPTLIVSVFLALAGVQSFFGGLILETIVQKFKQDFEIKLNEVNPYR